MVTLTSVRWRSVRVRAAAAAPARPRGGGRCRWLPVRPKSASAGKSVRRRPLAVAAVEHVVDRAGFDPAGVAGHWGVITPDGGGGQ